MCVCDQNQWIQIRGQAHIAFSEREMRAQQQLYFIVHTRFAGDLFGLELHVSAMSIKDFIFRSFFFFFFYSSVFC